VCASVPREPNHLAPPALVSPRAQTLAHPLIVGPLWPRLSPRRRHGVRGLPLPAPAVPVPLPVPLPVPAAVPLPVPSRHLLVAPVGAVALPGAVPVPVPLARPVPLVVHRRKPPPRRGRTPNAPVSPPAAPAPPLLPAGADVVDVAHAAGGCSGSGGVVRCGRGGRRPRARVALDADQRPVRRARGGRRCNSSGSSGPGRRKGRPSGGGAVSGKGRTARGHEGAHGGGAGDERRPADAREKGACGGKKGGGGGGASRAGESGTPWAHRGTGTPRTAPSPTREAAAAEARSLSPPFSLLPSCAHTHRPPPRPARRAARPSCTRATPSRAT
jgi:hypothetical protein